MSVFKVIVKYKDDPVNSVLPVLMNSGKSGDLSLIFQHSAGVYHSLSKYH